MSRVLDHAFDHQLKIEEHASMLLAGGIMQHGYQCGMLWGATLAAGAQAYSLFGPGPQAETKAILASQKLAASFRALNNTRNCLEITGIDKSSSPMQMTMYFLIKGGVIRCMRMAAQYAPVAFSAIHNAFAEQSVETPAPPVSCAAMLAQKVGLSDMHTVMAAGFTGGIGLSGDACGALGAAIWIMEMNHSKEGDGKMDFKNPRVLDVIDRFLQCTDAQFECSKIVGRTFENIADHAGYVSDGGCSKIIEALATKCSAG